LQHIAFLFSIEKVDSGKTKKAKSCTHRTKQKHAPENFAPKLCLHNVILYNSSNAEVRYRALKPAGCISTLCKIAARNPSLVHAHEKELSCCFYCALTAVRSSAGHRRMVGFFLKRKRLMI
jgi:hypothetical protein